jgi:hypothetical protein
MPKEMKRIKSEPGVGDAQEEGEEKEREAATQQQQQQQQQHSSLRRKIDEDGLAVPALQSQIVSLRAHAETQAAAIRGMEQARVMGEQVVELKAEIRIKDAALQAKDSVLEATVQSKDAVIQAKDAALQASAVALQAKDVAMQSKDAVIEGVVVATNVSDRRIQLRFADEIRPPFTGVIFMANVERFKAKASKARQAQSKAKQIEKLMEQAVDVPQVRRSPGKGAAGGACERQGRESRASVASPELCQRKQREREERDRGGVTEVSRGEGRGRDAQARTIN